ncbi:hypothetical protein WI665_10050 [Vibrio cholerae]
MASTTARSVPPRCSSVVVGDWIYGSLPGTDGTTAASPIRLTEIPLASRFLVENGTVSVDVSLTVLLSVIDDAAAMMVVLKLIVEARPAGDISRSSSKTSNPSVYVKRKRAR